MHANGTMLSVLTYSFLKKPISKFVLIDFFLRSIRHFQACDRQKMRPLHGASFHGSVDTARLLIEHGANILAVDETESIPFAHACRNSHYNIMEMFFDTFKQHPNINDIITAVDIEHNTLLHLAVISANLQIVELLLEKNADPSVKREDGQTAIHLCAKNDSVDILDKLINAGGNINELDSANETILHKAAAHNKEDVLKYVLSKQVNKFCHFVRERFCSTFRIIKTSFRRKTVLE